MHTCGQCVWTTVLACSRASPLAHYCIPVSQFLSTLSSHQIPLSLIPLSTSTIQQYLRHHVREVQCSNTSAQFRVFKDFCKKNDGVLFNSNHVSVNGNVLLSNCSFSIECCYTNDVQSHANIRAVFLDGCSTQCGLIARNEKEGFTH
eukprot:scaffold23105_cov91-Skeletonema_menzelii.AAC.1